MVGRVGSVIVFGARARQFDMEAAAGADLALQPYPPAHEIDDLTADRQAEAGAAVGAAGEPLGLAKLLEDAFLRLLGNPNPGVADGERERQQLRCRGYDRDRYDCTSSEQFGLTGVWRKGESGSSGLGFRLQRYDAAAVSRSWFYV